MRRMLFGLLTLGACATNTAALAEELSAMDDATSPLRKTLDPQVEIFRSPWKTVGSIRARTPRSRPRPRIRRYSTALAFALSRGHTSRAPDSGTRDADFIGPPFWASDQINIVGRKASLNALLGYQTIVDAIKFQDVRAARKPEFGGWIRKQASRRRRCPRNHMGIGRRAELPDNVFRERLFSMYFRGLSSR